MITIDQGVTEKDGVSPYDGITYWQGVAEYIKNLVAPPSTGFLLLESGSKILLEDGASFLLLE